MFSDNYQSDMSRRKIDPANRDAICARKREKVVSVRTSDYSLIPRDRRFPKARVTWASGCTEIEASDRPHIRSLLAKATEKQAVGGAMVVDRYIGPPSYGQARPGTALEGDHRFVIDNL